MPAIQRIPRGLLSLFDMKSAGGQTPSELAGYIQGVVDLEAYYLSDALTAAFAQNAAAGAVGSGVALTIPPGEVWRLVGLASQTDTVSAPGTKVLTLSVNPAGTFFGVPVVSQTQTVAIGDRISFGTGIFPVVLGSGSTLSCAVNANGGGGTMNLDVRALFHRFTA